MPPPSKNGPRGPCDPLPNTDKRKRYPERPCPNGRARWRSPSPPSGAGRVRLPGGMPRSTTGQPLLVGVKKPQTQQKGENKNNRKNRPEHPCRLASRKVPQEGASSLKPPKYRENPTKTPKRTGPSLRKAPRQNARKKGRTARTGDNKGGGDKNKEKETDQKGA